MHSRWEPTLAAEARNDDDRPQSPSPGHPSHTDYRPDIDGLRAVAVLSVVGYHAFPQWIKGGFIGVDIFFVISGFLISTIIVGGLERERFSFADFYSRRARRIFPALLLVLIVCLAFGWFLLLAAEYKQLGKHIAAGAGFVANFVLWNESGYFDSRADTKPLLHLWSLGIEEQFYIAWPLLLWAATKWRIHLLGLTLALAAASFALGASTVRTAADAAFYSPQTRIWELLLGAALACALLHGQLPWAQGGRWNPNVPATLGMALLAIGLLVITTEHMFPGWWALLPTVGAALVIAAGSHAWLNRALLSNRLMVWFGLISYPLYLWHWPLLSFGRIVESDTPSRTIRIAAVGVAIALAWLTYKLVEIPVRFGGGQGHRRAVMLVAGLLVVGLAGHEVYRHGGFDGFGVRMPGTQEFADHFENSLPQWRYYERIGAFQKNRVECNFYDVPRFRVGKATKVPLDRIHPSCYERDKVARRVAFIWGDSHAQHLNHGLANHLPAGWQILQVASSDCPADAGVREDSTTDHCQRSNWFALKSIAQARPDVVIVAQNSGHDAVTMSATAARLKALGVPRIVFAGPTPHWTSNLPNLVLRRLWSDTPERTLVGVDRRVMAENAALRRRFQAGDGVVLVDLIGLFCNEQGCLTRIDGDRKTGITSWDYGHLTPIASDYLARHLLADVVQGRHPGPE